MSEENVESFKRGVEAGNRGDIEAFLAELDPEVEYHAALPMVGGDAVYRGHEGFASGLKTLGTSSLKPSSSSPRFGTLATGSSR